MIHAGFTLGVLALLTTGISPARPQDPTDGKELDQVRALVKQLESQVALQRTALEQSEANLDRARRVLEALGKAEGVKASESLDRDDPTIKKLYVSMKNALASLNAVKARSRNPYDPSILAAQRRYESSREEYEQAWKQASERR